MKEGANGLTQINMSRNKEFSPTPALLFVSARNQAVEVARVGRGYGWMAGRAYAAAHQ